MTTVAPRKKVAVIDACVHHRWANPLELAAYLSPGWREFIGRPGLFPGGRGMGPLVPARGWTHPNSEWLPEAQPPGGGAPASNPSHLDAQLAERGVERAVLLPYDGLMAGALPHTAYSLDLVRAINDWTQERWLSASDRFHGLILVATQLPDEAGKEIRRCAANRKMVGVLLAGNGLSRPFGHPAYGAIYDAAADAGLPVVIHVGNEAPPNTSSHPVAGGLPSTFGAYYILRGQAVMTHIMSLIVQGVLDRHRGLLVVALGAGMAWLPGWLWRFDSDYKAYALRETPWMSRFPSEQVVEQVRVSTYSSGSIPDRAAFGRLLGSAQWMRKVLCYAGGFPSWDADKPSTIADLFPVDWQPDVMRNNSLAAFRWPGSST